MHCIVYNLHDFKRPRVSFFCCQECLIVVVLCNNSTINIIHSNRSSIWIQLSISLVWTVSVLNFCSEQFFCRSFSMAKTWNHCTNISTLDACQPNMVARSIFPMALELHCPICSDCTARNSTVSLKFNYQKLWKEIKPFICLQFLQWPILLDMIHQRIKCRLYMVIRRYI